jgi:hypothetical protein
MMQNLIEVARLTAPFGRGSVSGLCQSPTSPLPEPRPNGAVKRGPKGAVKRVKGAT